jgi:hypothetical protein
VFPFPGPPEVLFDELQMEMMKDPMEDRSQKHPGHEQEDDAR